MKCITLTLNPAFDRHCSVPAFVPFREHLAKNESAYAGGKGVNISRALSANGIGSLAVVVLGDENGAPYAKALENDGLHFSALTVGGRIRENLTVHTDDRETRISFEGFTSDDGLLDRVYETVKSELDENTVLTFTGRAPSGVSLSAILRFLEKIRATGAKTVIDSKSISDLNDLISAKPWLIKPNGEEISEYLHREISSFSEILEAAKSIHGAGIENVMVSLGKEGALLVCSGGEYICTPPKIEAISTVGAGDSSIAGFITAHLSGLDAKEALCRAVAYGTAACLRKGTLPPLPDDINRIIKSVKLSKA
ncbi:MAG: 1-phosphofructokinase family hexose kinase [Ruminococcaceae bacterium]|nr:1-phosphofructokinase family hexose kinase [Oscillospiraceae bacterium]